VLVLCFVFLRTITLAPRDLDYVRINFSRPSGDSMPAARFPAAPPQPAKTGPSGDPDPAAGYFQSSREAGLVLVSHALHGSPALKWEWRMDGLLGCGLLRPALRDFARFYAEVKPKKPMVSGQT
jgi:hypothetical protein